MAWLWVSIALNFVAIGVNVQSALRLRRQYREVAAAKRELDVAHAELNVAFQRVRVVCAELGIEVIEERTH